MGCAGEGLKNVESVINLFPIHSLVIRLAGLTREGQRDRG
jgi:hypothetical protein